MVYVFQLYFAIVYVAMYILRMYKVVYCKLRTIACVYVLTVCHQVPTLLNC